MNAPTLPKRRMKVPEFFAWAEAQPRGRFELVDGVVIAMLPERARHNLAKLAVARALEDAVSAAKLSCIVFTDGMSVVINEYMTREPDASVQCGADIDLNSTTLAAPLIVVEIVSPSSERDDSGVKVVEYFSVASIEHYLIIYPEKRVVVHHRRDGPGTLATKLARPGETIVLNPPGFSVPAAALLGPAPSEGAEAHS
jgi:Uma2 family endonuclease